MADFQFYLNRQGVRGPQGYKGDKGDDGKTPVPRTGTNTPIETTVIFDTGDGNPYETPNLKYPIEDRGGNMVMLDRTNSTQYYGTPDQATGNSYGVVKLATSESVLDDPLDSDVVTYELFDDNNQAIKATTDGLAGDITQLNTDLGAEVTNRTNADTQLTNKINTDVGNEATARNNADIALNGRIDGLNSSKANKSDVYTKTQTDSLLSNKSNVGHTHNYNDLTNKPTIGNGTITITQGGVVKGSFTTNQLSNGTIDLDAGGGGGGGGTAYTAGNGINITNDVISVKVDDDSIYINQNGELVANLPNAATSNTLGLVQPDGTTISVDANGVISANIPTPETVDQTYDASSTHAQSGVAIAGAGFLTSIPTATSSTKGIVQPDGTTTTVDSNGIISAISSAPTNMVTTDTQQVITGRKDMAIINIQPSGSTGYLNYITPISSGRIAISKSLSYDTSGTAPGILLGFDSNASITSVARGGSANYINMCTEYGNNTTEIRFCNGYTAGQVGSSHAGIGKYGNYTYIRNNNANDKKVYKITGSPSSTSSYTSFFLESDMLDGTTIQYNSTSGKVEALGSQQEGVLPVSDDVIEIYTTNYTIIGNPTITSDHVFSTTSGSDSLTSVVPFRSAAAATAHSLKFGCQFRPTASSHSNGEGIFCRDSSSDGIRISLNASACVRFRTTINGSGALDVTFSNTPLVQNTLYKLTAEIAAGASSGTGTLYTSADDGATWTTAETVPLGTNTPLAIGSGASSLHYFGVNTPGPTLPFGGEILLDKMYLEEDGTVIWTPVAVSGNITEIGKASENTYGLVKIDGIYLKYDSTTGCVTLDIQAIKDAIDALT